MQWSLLRYRRVVLEPPQWIGRPVSSSRTVFGGADSPCHGLCGAAGDGVCDVSEAMDYRLARDRRAAPPPLAWSFLLRPLGHEPRLATKVDPVLVKQPNDLLVALLARRVEG
jgi:hypothetical protein